MKKMKLDIQLFNGSVAIQTITEATDDSLNQSTFTIPAKMTTTGVTYNNSNASMTLQWKYESGSTWTTISKQTFSISKNSSKTKSWTLTLTHQDNGKLENLNFRVQWYITDSTNGTTGVKTVEPTTIPRASEITSVSSGTTVYNPTIVWTPLSSSFKYKVKYTGILDSQSSISGLISPNTTSSYSYNGLSVYHYAFANANSSTITATATLYTYKSDGTTLIGQKTKTFSITLNSEVKPTISFSNLAEADTTMQNANWGIYVQNHSKLSFKVTTGSSLLAADSVATTITTNGQTFNQNGYTNNTFTTTNVLSSSGTNTISATARDNRDRSTTASTTYNVVAYSNPTIATAQVQRCNANGNIDNNGEYMYISYGASISSCSNKNTPSAVYKVGYRVHNTGSYTYVNLTTNANSYSASGVLFTDGIKAASSSGTKVQFSTNNTYDIQFYVKDYFTEYTNVQLLDAGFDLMNFNPSGKAMAIGKVSEAGANEELLEIGMNTRIDGTFTTNTWGTNNTIDTWVPVWRDGYLEHRVIPSTYNSTSPILTGLSVNGNGTINGNLVVDSIRTKNMAVINNTNINFTSYYYVDIPVCEISNLEANTQYIISYDISGAVEPFNLKIGYGNSYFEQDLTEKSNNYNGHIEYTFTIGTLPQLKKLYFRPCSYTSPTTVQNCVVSNIQLEKGSTATTYSPYQDLQQQNIYEYSTYEKCIGTWINGKPLYRRTFGYNNINLNQETTLYWNNTMYGGSVLSNVDEIINYKAFYKRSDNTYQMVPNVHSNPTAWGSGIYDLNANSFAFWVGSLYGAFSINYLIITIEYTKTID